MKNEECVREALKTNLPATLLIAKYKPKEIVTGLITVLSNYFEV
jgi:hypothetical protein